MMPVVVVVHVAGTTGGEEVQVLHGDLRRADPRQRRRAAAAAGIAARHAQDDAAIVRVVQLLERSALPQHV
jgi:hypothetical protein